MLYDKVKVLKRLECSKGMGIIYKSEFKEGRCGKCCQLYDITARCNLYPLVLCKSEELHGSGCAISPIHHVLYGDHRHVHLKCKDM
jgi:hypothetical protein